MSDETSVRDRSTPRNSDAFLLKSEKEIDDLLKVVNLTVIQMEEELSGLNRTELDSNITFVPITSDGKVDICCIFSGVTLDLRHVVVMVADLGSHV